MSAVETAAMNAAMTAAPAAPEPARDIRVAMVIDPGLPAGQIANTAAVIGVGLGAADGSLGAVPLTDRAGRTIASSSNQPIPVLQADATAMAALLGRALPAPDGGTVVAFLRFGRSLHVFEDYRRRFPDLDLLKEPVDGIGLAGPARWVRSLTGALKLLR